jgi:hypothetical protein
MLGELQILPKHAGWLPSAYAHNNGYIKSGAEVLLRCASVKKMAMQGGIAFRHSHAAAAVLMIRLALVVPQCAINKLP